MITKQRAVEAVLAAFSTVSERRVERTRAHELVDILTIALLTFINGGKGWDDMGGFAKVRLGWLRGFLEPPNGAPEREGRS